MAESLNTIDQNQVDLLNRIDSCENSMKYLAANYNLQEFLQLDETEYLQVGRAAKGIGELLYNVLTTNPYFKSLQIYSDKNFRVLSNFLQNNAEETKEEWYQEILKNPNGYWWEENGRIYFGRPIMAPYPNEAVGVARIELKQELFAESFQIFRGTPVRIEMLRGQDLFYVFETQEYQREKGVRETRVLDDEIWNLTYQINRSYYTTYFWINFMPVIFIIVSVLALCWLVIRYFFHKFTDGLSILVKDVECAKKGNFDIEITTSGFTELNILSESIQSFLDRIKQLIRQVYGKEIERQRLEINLLQSKISPHFLYNNLSAINWLALECGQDQIYEIATELATFYRTVLNKGNDVDCLRIEMENVKSYLKLQLIAHEYNFQVRYDVTEELLNVEVPIFVLQPLVENSIEHGIHQLRDKTGEIQISVRQRGEWMEMTVFDNGSSLYEKIGNEKLPVEKYGYGTSNVHKRIQLLYGEESGLTIRADETGTYAQILFQYQKRRIFIS